jgi:hypothetical protein
MKQPLQFSLSNLLTRRDMLTRCGMGFAGLGLIDLLARQGDLHAQQRGVNTSPLAVRQPHFPGKAKRVIHLFMNGGPSHVDTFDPKPLLARYAGQPLPRENLRTERRTGAAFPSPFKFQRHGKSGIEVSELFPHVAESIDDICVIRSMYADVPNHEPSLLLLNCGDARQVRPSLGSWVTYGLGSENQNLPGFIAMCPGGYPIQESQNWQSAFLPGAFQGTYIDTQHQQLDRLIENIRNTSVSRDQQRQQLDLLQQLNQRHLEKRAADAQLEARIQSFELAYGMQRDAEDAFDVSREPQYIRDMYGPGVQARQILIARRLLEKGVRFIQIWHGQGQPWDNHDDLEVNHRRLARQCDQAIGALLKDLKARGMLDDTLIIWGGEFGRTPMTEGSTGRDHNPHGFTMWLAGGGVKGGQTIGSTDAVGLRAADDITPVHDIHATILHLLGLDHERLTARHNGRDERLTDVSGNVIERVLA